MEFSKNDLKAIITTTSKDDTRYNLKFARFEADRAVSTDGHRLSIVNAVTADEKRDAYHVSRRVLETLVKGMGTKETAVFVEGENAEGVRRILVTVNGSPRGEFRPDYDDEGVEIGEYPNYLQVLPKKEAPPAVTFGINAKYLRELCATFEKFSDKACVQVSVRDALSPVEFVAKDSDLNEKAVGVIMPMRLK